MAVGIVNLVGVVGGVSAIVAAISDLKDVKISELKSEITDIDSSEKEKLAEVFRTKFKIENKSAEETIEKGFEMILTVLELAGKFVF